MNVELYRSIFADSLSNGLECRRVACNGSFYKSERDEFLHSLFLAVFVLFDSGQQRQQLLAEGLSRTTSFDRCDAPFAGAFSKFRRS